MTNVEPLRKEAAIEDRITALEQEKFSPGVDVTLGLPVDDKRAMQVKTAFNQGLSAHDYERIIARLISVGRVLELREKIVDHRAQLRNAERNLEQCSPDALRKATLSAELSELRTELPQTRQRQLQEYRDSGRSGEFKQSKAQQAITDRIVADIDAKEKAIKEIDAEFERKRGELAKAVKNWNVAIQIAEDEIAVRREAYGA